MQPGNASSGYLATMGSNTMVLLQGEQESPPGISNLFRGEGSPTCSHVRDSHGVLLGLQQGKTVPSWLSLRHRKGGGSSDCR